MPPRFNSYQKPEMKNEFMTKEDRAKLQSEKAKNPGKGLETPKWEKLDPFEKNFYVPHTNAVNRNDEEIEEFRKKLEITVMGSSVPQPTQALEESNFPDSVMIEMQKQGFTTPTSIQAQGWPIALSGRDMVGEYIFLFEFVTIFYVCKLLANTLLALRHVFFSKFLKFVSLFQVSLKPDQEKL